MEKPSAAELLATLQDAEVVVAAWPDGAQAVLAGKDVLERVVDSGQSERIRMATIHVGSTNEAEVVAAAVELIQSGELGAPQIETLQKMLDHARSLA